MFSVSGTTMVRNGMQNKKAVAYWDTVEYRKALDTPASIIVMQFGTNDAAEQNWYYVLYG